MNNRIISYNLHNNHQQNLNLPPISNTNEPIVQQNIQQNIHANNPTIIEIIQPNPNAHLPVNNNNIILLTPVNILYPLPQNITSLPFLEPETNSNSNICQTTPSFPVLQAQHNIPQNVKTGYNESYLLFPFNPNEILENLKVPYDEVVHRSQFRINVVSGTQFCDEEFHKKINSTISKNRFVFYLKCKSNSSINNTTNSILLDNVLH